MSKHFQKLLNKFKKLNLPDGQYAIYGSGSLGVRNIREVRDLDVIVLGNLYQELKEKHSRDSKKERIKIEEIEIYPFWAWKGFNDLDEMIKRAELIEGVRFICLNDLMECKKKMGRLKDFKDIELIKDFLSR